MRDGAVQRHILVILLRLAGCVMVMAFPAMLLPIDWMADTHRWLGLGEFPRTPVVDYLTRSIAALYGFHGALLLLISRDPVHYAPVVRFVGVMNIVFAAMVIAIDLHADMPGYWTWLEGPPIAAFGVVVLYLSRARLMSARERSSTTPR